MSLAPFTSDEGLAQALPVVAQRWLQYKPRVVLLPASGFHNLGTDARSISRANDVALRGGVFEFPGVNGYIDMGAGALVNHTAHTMLAVCQIDSFPSAYPILASIATSSTRVSCFFSTDPGYTDFSYGTTGGGFTARCSLTASGPVLGTKRNIVVVRSSDTSAGHSFFVNGKKLTTVTSSAHGARTGNSVIGQAEVGNLSFDFDGRLWAFVLFDAVLPDQLALELATNPDALFEEAAEVASFADVEAGGGADFTHNAAGGLQYAGAASADFTRAFAQTADGGLQYAGAASADFTRAFAQTAAGGLQYAGAASADFTRAFAQPAAGGLQYAGAASTTFTFNYAQAASGGLQYAGAATTAYTADFSAASSGGLQLGGSAGATAGVEFLATSSGGLQLNGSASTDFTRAFAQVAAGGLQLAGAAGAAATADFTLLASGGLQFGGEAGATAGVEFLATASGGLQIGGAASVTFTRDFQQGASGGMLLGGHADAEASQGFAVLGAGGIFFAGGAAAAYSAGYLASASGGLRFGGSALIESSNEPATFPPVSRRIATSQTRRVVAGGQRIVRG